MIFSFRRHSTRCTLYLGNTRRGTQQQQTATATSAIAISHCCLFVVFAHTNRSAASLGPDTLQFKLVACYYYTLT